MPTCLPAGCLPVVVRRPFAPMFPPAGARLWDQLPSSSQSWFLDGHRRLSPYGRNGAGPLFAHYHFNEDLHGENKTIRTPGPSLYCRWP